MCELVVITGRKWKRVGQTKKMIAYSSSEATAAPGDTISVATEGITVTALFVLRERCEPSKWNEMSDSGVFPQYSHVQVQNQSIDEWIRVRKNVAIETLIMMALDQNDGEEMKGRVLKRPPQDRDRDNVFNSMICPLAAILFGIRSILRLNYLSVGKLGEEVTQPTDTFIAILCRDIVCW